MLAFRTTLVCPEPEYRRQLDDIHLVRNFDRRAHLKARIDAAYMIMYGMSIEDADYILETFPIVKRQDEKAYGFYRTKELIKGYMRALAAGDWETVVSI